MTVNAVASMTDEGIKSSTPAVSADPSSSCWSCGTMRAVHFCSACGKVQPPVPVDYFKFVGFPRKLTLDLAALEREFYALSRRLHPDLYARASSQEKQWSLEQSSLLNDAYRTLKDPIRRTEYLLRLEGIELEEQSKAATENARTAGELKRQVVAPDLLEEVFELNMQLEELRRNKRAGEQDEVLVDELESRKEDFEREHDKLISELQRCWAEWDDIVDDSSSDNRMAIRHRMMNVLNRRTYIRNLVRDVNEALEG